MRISLRFAFLLLLACFGCEELSAQVPRVYLKFDGDLTDSSGAGIITSIGTTNITPAFTFDRNGVDGKALVLPGSSSLELIAATLPTDSNQALGLRTGLAGSPFTLVAWAYVNSLGVATGYNVIFGNTGTGAGTLHAGFLQNRAHLGFDGGNDATGAGNVFDSGKWYHLAFVYDGTSQRIYVNGVPEITRTGTNTLKAANMLIGNWSTLNNNNNDLIGRLDDVAIFGSALSISQVQALYRGAEATAIPAAYSAPRLTGPLGAPGFWGVREIKSYPLITYNSLVNVDRVFNGYVTAPGGTVLNYTAPVINHIDPQSAGISGYFANEANFGTNQGGNDDNFAMLAKGTIRIAVEDDYTFGFRGDEGSRLRIQGATFVSGTAIGVNNLANPVAQGDAIYFTTDTTDSATLGVTHLTPGDYAIEYVYWEHNNAASCEVFAARGAKTSVDASFQLVGNTAAGGLELVRDVDSYPRILSFTGNGGAAVVINNGVPATVTLAWQTNNVPTSIVISPDIGLVSPSGSQSIPAPTQTTTYTITATAGADVATQTLTVYVDSPPVITNLVAPSNAVVGSNVLISWSTVGATSLVLQPGNIDVTALTSRIVNPPATTTYTLFATNGFGTVQQSVTVVAGTAPVINSFVIGDPNPIYGAETSLNWNITGADSIAINQGVGPVSGAIGSASIVSLQTTTYTLTATNIYGSSSANTTLTVATPIGVLAPGFSARKVVATVPFPFAGQGYLQSAVSLVGGQNVSSQVTQNGLATINLWDNSTDGDFTTGNGTFPGGSIGANTAVVITATLVVNSPGEYTFVVNCDDGARLRIDGVDVISDDSTHSPGGNSGKITLSKQTAQLELIYYNATGGAEVELGWIRPNLTWQLLSTITPAAAIVRGQVLISEFSADNGNEILDEDGASSDWVEIWNSTNATVNLGGYYLTDNPSSPAQWAFPAWTLSPNEYLIVFASGKDRLPAQATAGKDNLGTLAQPHLHTSFSLSKSGGSILLTKNNGAGGYTTVSSFISYPAQSGDISYGSSDSEGYIGFIDAPTPGGPNAATVGGFVKGVTFDHLRGRYSAPFNLVLSSPTPGATIRYTLNGSAPTLNNGTVYTAPLLISATKVVRAAAFKAGWRSSGVDSHSFLFIDDIVTQTTSTATGLGFPNSAVNGQVFRYGMTLANVTSGGGTLQSLKNALAAMPTVSMSTEVANLADATTGIYANPSRHGLFWERPVSMEYINAAGTSEFGINCGVRIRGGFSRSTSNPKHAFHMYFRGSLYDGNLKYRLFGNAGASEFDQIDMRSEENYSWGFGNDPQNLLVREEWSRVTQGDMGQPYARTAYFHLYINGVYWGVYNFEERTEAAYGETYLGGIKENQDVVKSAGSSGGYNTEMTDGNFAAWTSLNNQALALKSDNTETGRTAKYMKMRGLNPDGTSNPAFPVLLDADNLIDYELIVFYDGSFDSPMSTFLVNASNNWFGVRDRLGMRGFTFYAHDHEHGMESVNDGRAYNRIGPWGGSGTNNWGQGQYGSREGGTLITKSNPHYLHEFLCYSAEYRQRFADRVQRHFFNGGALTTTKALARFNTLAAQVDTIIHAEAARWGSASLNRNSWLTAKSTATSFINSGGSAQAGQTNFGTPPTTGALTGRSWVVVQQCLGYTDPLPVSTGAKPLFSALLSPAITGAFGGNVTAPYNLTLTNPNAVGAIYYTTNGVDPRPIGGGAPSGALTGASPIPVTLNNSAVLRARIYNSATLAWSPLIEPVFVAGVPASSANLVISKLHYHPASANGLEEFVELMNISTSNNIDLSNVRFTLGIQFNFPLGYLLAPGARILIVRDMAAFTAAYPNVPAEQIVGVFANGSFLSNGGERLQLVGAGDVVIRDFSYGQTAPWPTGPDGDGPSLVLMRPEKNPDHSIAANWRASVSTSGAPGVTDTLTYAAWAAANNVTDAIGTLDDDGDGALNLCEFAMNQNPKVPSTMPIIPGSQNYVINSVAGDYLTLNFTRPIGRDEIAYSVEASNDLAAPWTAGVLVSGPVNNGNGTETLVYRHPLPQAGQAQQYLRLRFTRLP